MIVVTNMIELTAERVQTADFILEVGAWCILVRFGTVQDVGNQTGKLMGCSNGTLPLHVTKNHMHAERLLQIYTITQLDKVYFIPIILT